MTSDKLTFRVVARQTSLAAAVPQAGAVSASASSPAR